MEKRTQNVKSAGNGEGSFYIDKKTGRLVYQFTANSGKRPRIMQRKNERTRDFKARATKIKSQVDEGTYIEKDKTILYDYMSKIIDDRLKRNLISECTYGRNIQALNLLKKIKIVKKPIQKITVLELQEVMDSFSSYSNSVIDKVYQVLNSAFEKARKQKIISENIMRDIDKPKSSKKTKKIEAFTIEEQEAFVKQLKDEKYKDILIIALYTGMRMGEILALKVDDIDFKHKEIHIQRTLTKNKDDKVILGDKTKTYAGNRIIPITPLFEKELRHAISNMVINENSLIFTQQDGKLIYVSTINSRFKRICVNANLGVKEHIIKRPAKTKKEKIIHSKTSTYNQHMLRHTYATRMIEAGVPAEVLQKLLGHKDVSITINTYTSIFDKYKQKHIDKYVEYIEENGLK